MKHILPMIAAAFAILPIQAQWETVSCPRANLTVQGPYENPSKMVDTSLEALRALNKQYWFAYYTNSQWNNWSGVDEDNHFYLVSSVTTSGWNKVFGGTQLVKRFELPAAGIEGATQVKVSFDIMKVVPISFDVSVNPWTGGGPLAADAGLGAQSSQGNSVFNFSIVSLRTGNIILSDKGANWHHSGVNYDRTNVSFILEGDDLYGGDMGYALVVTSVYDGLGTSNMDCYVFENTRIEKMTQLHIPEPATGVLAAFGLMAVALNRRRS